MQNKAHETWMDVEGYEGKYRISSTGRLVSLMGKSPKVLKPNIIRSGYMTYRLYKGRHQKAHLAHRLVAQSFLSNPSSKPQVNHINGIKTDNRIENLEWATKSENQKHSFLNGLNKSHAGALSRNFKGPIIATSKTDKAELILLGSQSITENGFDPRTVYRLVCNAAKGSHKGYTFRRASLEHQQ